MSRQSEERTSEVGAALSSCRPAFGGVALFSAVINVLMLTGSIYMLQIYDRVLASPSLPTLVGISLIVSAPSSPRPAPPPPRARGAPAAPQPLDPRGHLPHRPGGLPAAGLARRDPLQDA